MDPGRTGMAWEYLKKGDTLIDVRLEHHGGSLQVTSHAASERGPPPGEPAGTRQEWRVLAFTPDDGGTTDLVQSVTKVCVPPTGSARLRAEVLPMSYTKSMATITLATLAALGAPVLPSDERAQHEKLRVLCIGLGAGSVPSFLAGHLPHCEVDAVELEPAVCKAAVEGMGLELGPRLRVHVEDGVRFALRAAGEATGEADSATGASTGGGAYDAVLIDAYDAAGNVPSELWSREGGLCRALAAGLLNRRAGVVATNFLPGVDYGPPLAAYRSALGGGASVGFSVQAKGSGTSGNRIAVHACGGPPGAASWGREVLRERLEAAARQVDHAIGCNFDMPELAVRGLDEATGN